MVSAGGSVAGARQVQNIRALLHAGDVCRRAEQDDFAVRLTEGFQAFKAFAAVMQGMRAGREGKVCGSLPFGRLPFAVLIGDNGHLGVENAAEHGGYGSAHDGYSQPDFEKT